MKGITYLSVGLHVVYMHMNALTADDRLRLKYSYVDGVVTRVNG